MSSERENQRRKEGAGTRLICWLRRRRGWPDGGREEAAGAVVGGSRGVAGWFGRNIEEGKVVAADLERGRSRGRGGWSGKDPEEHARVGGGARGNRVRLGLD